ncbi:MAG: GerMN domain-containing protein [Tyzzerella sp.]|nr:GerMN domain-containing protein [Tyzzerella sp.]
MRKRLGVILCLVWSIILCGCTSAEKAEDEMYIYYINTEGNALVQEIYPKLDVKGALDKLMKPDNSTKQNVVIPEKLALERYELNKGQLILTFNNEYLQMKKSTEVLFRAAVVQTMVQVKGVTFVSFYIGEEPLKDTDGTAIGLMRAEDFVQNVGYTSDSYQTTDLRLYFSSKDGMTLKSVKKNSVHYNTNTSIEKLVVEQLMKGTSASGAQPTIPKTTKLLGVSVKDGICYVNFDSKFASDGYDQNPEVTIYSIVNSIIQNGTAAKVQILIDGSSDTLYKGTVDLSRPLEWNSALMEEKE